MQDIHDIRPPVQVGTDPIFIKIALAAAAVLILAALVYAAARFFLKKKRENTPDLQVLTPSLPPLEAAMEAIRDLGNFEGPDLRVFYFRLTAILKKYMGQVFSFHAVEMTSQEFIRAIRQVDLDKKILNQISNLMDGADRIKYAGDIPLEQMLQEDLEQAKTIIIRISEQLKTPEDENV